MPTFREVLRSGADLIRALVSRNPRTYVVAVLGAILFVSAIVASALVIGDVTDELIIPAFADDATVSIFGGLAAIVAVAAWKAIGIVVRRIAAGWLMLSVRDSIRRDLIAHQLDLRLAWFEDRSTGDLLSISETDTSVATFVLAPLPYATGAALLLVGVVAAIGVIDLWLAVVGLVALALTVVVDVTGGYRTYRAFRDVQDLQGGLAATAHESFDGALTVKALGREQYETDRFRRRSEALRDRVIDVGKTWAGYQAVVNALPPIATVALLVLGALRVANDVITVGEVVSVAYLMSLLNIPIRLIGYVLWDTAESSAAWSRVKAILEVDDPVPYGSVTATSGQTGADVAGAEVTFGYDDEAVLSDIELQIPSGHTVAIVGPTASGKSSLARLLARLWDPDSGAIRLDRRDLRSFARSELPREMAFVSQEAFLFDDSVAGNVALGVDLRDGDLERALDLAGASEFVERLPEGRATRLGERGTTLSGGQRQRIALARALARRPRLLLLDDATSAVDPSVEAAILRRLRDAELPSTVLIVAYRPASIRLADEVLYMESGRIAGFGRHEELMRTLPGYRRLMEAYESDVESGS